MSSNVSTVVGTTCVVPDTMGSRGLNIPEDVVTDEFLSEYDNQTLFYDAVQLKYCVRLFSPSLGHFEHLLRTAQFRVGSKLIKPRIKKRRARYCQIDLPSKKSGALSISCEDWHWQGKPSQQETKAFEGTNATVLFNKDNEIDWIKDQLYFHQRHHSLNAAVIVDNGSQTYTPIELSAALATLNLQAVRVLNLPAQWGPLGPPGYRNLSLFFQSAALNLVRQRFLRRARAVLICDVDELVLPRPDGLSVFDAAAQSWHGWLPFKGRNLYPQIHTQGPPRHADHGLRNIVPEPQTRKYCVGMRRPIGLVGWKVHKPDAPALDKYMDRSVFRLIHCQGIKSGWKDAVSPAEGGLSEDKEAIEALTKIWPREETRPKDS